METRARSLLKAVIWNALGLAIMASVGILMTRSPGTGGAIALVNAALGFATYILYERVWNAIRWGRDV